MVAAAIVGCEVERGIGAGWLCLFGAGPGWLIRGQLIRGQDGLEERLIRAKEDFVHELAVWESVGHFRQAFTHPEYWSHIADYPQRGRFTPPLREDGCAHIWAA
jgi:hypothetical protein